jgi:WD40 repeat protein
VTALDCLVRDGVGGLKVWDEESGALHREFEPLMSFRLTVLASFLSADGQQPRLVAGASNGQLRIYDPEAGSLLHQLHGHASYLADVACIASSSAAPHHPRLVSASYDGTAKVWDGETGEMLADLPGHEGPVTAVAVWKEHTGNHDRIASAGFDGHVRVWDGEAFTLLQDIPSTSGSRQVLPFETAEGPSRLLVARRPGD